MKGLIVAALVLVYMGANAQTANEVSITTRPVLINNAYINKARYSGNAFVSYNRMVYKLKSSSIWLGAYGGGTFSADDIHQTWKDKMEYTHHTNYNAVLGLRARYNFYESGNGAFAAQFSFLGEVIWTDAVETYRNISDAGFFIYDRPVADNYLLPYQTKTLGYANTKFNLLAEMGISQRIYKGFNATAAAMWNIHTNDFIGSAGLGYRF